MAELWSRLASAQTMMESWKVLSHVKKVWIGHTFGTVHCSNRFHWNANLMCYTEVFSFIMAKNEIEMWNMFCLKRWKKLIWHLQWHFFLSFEYLIHWGSGKLGSDHLMDSCPISTQGNSANTDSIREAMEQSNPWTNKQS